MKYQYKRKLIGLLLQDKMKEKEANRKILRKLFIFIDHILRLPKQAEDKLVQELKTLIGANLLKVVVKIQRPILT